jgi:hypothetical protein
MVCRNKYLTKLFNQTLELEHTALVLYLVSVKFIKGFNSGFTTIIKPIFTMQEGGGN